MPLPWHIQVLHGYVGFQGLAPCHEPTPESSTEALWSHGALPTSSTPSQLMMFHDNIKIGLLDRK